MEALVLYPINGGVPEHLMTEFEEMIWKGHFDKHYEFPFLSWNDQNIPYEVERHGKVLSQNFYSFELYIDHTMSWSLDRMIPDEHLLVAVNLEGDRYLVARWRMRFWEPLASFREISQQAERWAQGWVMRQQEFQSDVTIFSYLMIIAVLIVSLWCIGTIRLNLISACCFAVAAALVILPRGYCLIRDLRRMRIAQKLLDAKNQSPKLA